MNKTYTDEQLVAYLDGQLSAEQTHAIQDQLTSDPALTAQLAALSIDTSAISETFDRVLPLGPQINVAALPIDAGAKPATQPAAPVVVNKNRFTQLLPLAASVIVALGVGLFAGLYASSLFENSADNHVAHWQQAVVDYQVLYVADTLPDTAPNENDKARQLAAISAASGMTITDTMVDLPGVDFRRAQTLGINGSPLIQIAFAGPNGEPFALCFTPVDKPASKPLAQAIDGMNTVSWRNGEYGFILVSFADPKQVEAAASKAIELF